MIADSPMQILTYPIIVIQWVCGSRDKVINSINVLVTEPIFWVRTIMPDIAFVIVWKQAIVLCRKNKPFSYTIKFVCIAIDWFRIDLYKHFCFGDATCYSDFQSVAQGGKYGASSEEQTHY